MIGWGANDWGQLGDGTKRHHDAPVQVLQSSGDDLLSGVKAIASHSWPNVALLEDGTLRSWGANDYGQLGNGTKDTPSQPVVVSDLDKVKTIGVGTWHMLAVQEDGTVWAWGRNEQGQLGDGMTDNIRNKPVQVRGLADIKFIGAGELYSVACR